MTTGSSPSGLPPTPALASPNQTGLSVGSISGISKKGWEYLWGAGGGAWVRYADTKDTGSGAIIKRPPHRGLCRACVRNEHGPSGCGGVRTV